MSATTAPPQRAARRGRRGTRSRCNPAAFARNAAQLLPWPTVTPLATAMVLLLLITALLLRTHPSDVNPVVAWASTNLHNLAHHPVAAMLVSMFVVTGNLLPELLDCRGQLRRTGAGSGGVPDRGHRAGRAGHGDAAHRVRR